MQLTLSKHTQMKAGGVDTCGMLSAQSQKLGRMRCFFRGVRPPPSPWGVTHAYASRVSPLVSPLPAVAAAPRRTVRPGCADVVAALRATRSITTTSPT